MAAHARGSSLDRSQLFRPGNFANRTAKNAVAMLALLIALTAYAPGPCWVGTVATASAPGTRATSFIAAQSETASLEQPRRVIFGLQSLRAAWARCDEQLCRVGGLPNPVRFVRMLLPKRRPLTRLQLCEEGTIKVMKIDGTRQFIREPKRDQISAECSVSDAMEFL